MNLPSVLALGFVLGLRHATDADHVVAVSTMVTTEKSLRRAALLGITWGVGHSLTILAVGGAIVAAGVTVPARVGLVLELVVAAMLVALGILNVSAFLRARIPLDPAAVDAGPKRGRGLARSLAVGVVHGLAGSAGIGLLVAATMDGGPMAIAWLAILGIGTLCGMTAVTCAIAAPLLHFHPFRRFGEHLRWASGVASVVTGVVLAYEIVVRL